MTHPDNVVLRTAGSRTRADEWALVLAAEGLSPSVRRERGVFAVRLPASQVEAATEALAAYERENPPVPERDVTPAEEHRSSRAGTLVAAALLLFFFVSGPRDAGSPWFEAGSADAGRIVDGEFWRVVTALTLHSDMAHVAANAIMGAILINAACAVLGNGLGLAAVLLAGAGGNWINAWMQPAVHSSVGASTAVFAALGLLCGPALSRLRTRGVRGDRLLAPLGAGLGVIAMLGVGGRADGPLGPPVRLRGGRRARSSAGRARAEAARTADPARLRRAGPGHATSVLERRVDSAAMSKRRAALERNHQGLNNELIEKPSDEPNMDGAVECQERLGGVLESYYRRAA